jgi:hypothetical protein|nr:MAG TPA: coiled coil protein [Caudoviricetes sp.]
MIIEVKNEEMLGKNNNNLLYTQVITLQKENQQLKEQLETSERARKEAIKYVKKTSGYDNPYNDTFLNTYAVDNLLEILDKGEQII